MSHEADLRDAMLAAHEAGDKQALPGLYLKAAQLREGQGDIDAACFFYTHAYVYGLDFGDTATANLARTKLKSFGRER